MKKILLFTLPVILLLQVIYVDFSYASAIKDTINISLESTVETPAPGQTVFLQLSSYSVDINALPISWYENGEEVLSGIGERRHSFRAGPFGSSTKIEVKIDIGTLGFKEKQKTFYVYDVDMLWESTDSYTHPFYKGAALLSAEGSVSIVAIPNIDRDGVREKSSNLIYTWKKDGKYRLLSGQSGYGKNRVVIKNDLLSSGERIEVEVSDRLGNNLASKVIFIGRVDPKISLYEVHPIQGVLYEKDLSGDVVVDKKELSVIAEPMFFSTKNRSSLKLQWTTGTNKVLNPPNNILTFGHSGKSGKVYTSILIENVSKILQVSTKTLGLEIKELNELYN